MRFAVMMLVLLAAFAGRAQSAPVLLWPGGAPQQTEATGPDTMRITDTGEHVLTHVIAPTITPYLPAAGTQTGVAVVIAPGGGHSEIWIDHEGDHVAEYLRRHGVAAFVLTYRLAREKDSTGATQQKYTVEGTELGDMQRAVRLVRSRAAEWHIDPARVGVMGFSAGGELALLASTRYDTVPNSSPQGIDLLSAKPAFQALLYPGNLNPDHLADKRLTAATPPAFLACGAEDRPDISQGLPELYLVLARVHVPAELHIFARTGHGFGVRASNPRACLGLAGSLPALARRIVPQLCTGAFAIADEHLQATYAFVRCAPSASLLLLPGGVAENTFRVSYFRLIRTVGRSSYYPPGLR